MFDFLKNHCSEEELAQYVKDNVVLRQWCRKDISLVGLYETQTWIVSGAKLRVAVYVGKKEKIADGIGTLLSLSLIMLLLYFLYLVFSYNQNVDPSKELRVSEFQSFWVAERLMKVNLLTAKPGRVVLEFYQPYDWDLVAVQEQLSDAFDNDYHLIKLLQGTAMAYGCVIEGVGPPTKAHSKGVDFALYLNC